MTSTKIVDIKIKIKVKPNSPNTGSKPLKIVSIDNTPNKF